MRKFHRVDSRRAHRELASTGGVSFSRREITYLDRIIGIVHRGFRASGSVSLIRGGFDRPDGDRIPDQIDLYRIGARNTFDRKGTKLRNEDQRSSVWMTQGDVCARAR